MVFICQRMYFPIVSLQEDRESREGGERDEEFYQLQPDHEKREIETSLSLQFD